MIEGDSENRDKTYKTPKMQREHAYVAESKRRIKDSLTPPSK